MPTGCGHAHVLREWAHHGGDLERAAVAMIDKVVETFGHMVN